MVLAAVALEGLTLGRGGGSGAEQLAGSLGVARNKESLVLTLCLGVGSWGCSAGETPPYSLPGTGVVEPNHSCGMLTTGPGEARLGD